jgi:hypothetical protein
MWRSVWFICWVSVAISTACALLNVEKFYPDQEEALCIIYVKEITIFSAHTGYEKSLVSQAILIMADKFGTGYIAIMITYEESSKAYQ